MTTLQIYQRSVEEPFPVGHPRDFARIVFADPPYNIGVKYDADKTGDWLPEDDYFALCERWIKNLAELCVPGGTFWWLCPPSHVDRIGPLLTKHVGYRRYLIIKRESFAQYQQASLTEDYRLLFCHVKTVGVSPDAFKARSVEQWGRDQVVFNPDAIREKSVRQEMGNKRADPRGRVPGQVWDIRRLQGTAKHRVDWHPAQLPPELLERIVLGWSNPGDMVVDGFAGSGSLGEVCKSHGRHFTGYEQSEKYVRKAKERLGLAAD